MNDNHLNHGHNIISPCLNWDCKRYLDNILVLFLFFTSAPETVSGIVDENYPVIVHHTGELTYIPFWTLNSYCALNLENFPYDIQECNIVLGSWAFHAKELEIKFMGQEASSSTDVNLGSYDASEHPTWSLVNKKVSKPFIMNTWVAQRV